MVERNNNSIQLSGDNSSLGENDLFAKVAELIESSHQQVAKAVNTAMVYTYYGVGRYIVEFEQGGDKRSELGKAVLRIHSEQLTEKFGSGWSVETLTKCRKFYSIYSISSPVKTKSTEFVISESKVEYSSCRLPKSATVVRKSDIVHSVDDIHEFILPKL